MNIKKHYAVPKGWQGDPCRPAPTWNGINCSQDDDIHSPRITSLNLAVRDLVGDIPSSLSNLTSLTYLNLSYNRLTGVIPDFLANLSSLQILDLKSNNLTGRVPTALRKKKEKGTLDLRWEDNPGLCTSGSCNKRNWKKIPTILGGTIGYITLIVTAIALAAIYKYKQKKPANNRGNNVGFSMNNNVNEEYELPIYDLYVVAQATNHFSISNKVGEGGFGPVYKGVLSDGQEIAVKRLSKDSRQGSDEFKNEVIFIAKLQHRNLVKLLGCCIEAEERLLIYEYMPNKSLDFYIFEPTSRELLDWPKRLEIIKGIARGLLYLHQDSRLRIVHRDLKASNILLDSEMNAKISDFGLARSFNGAQDAATTKRVVGTYGYMPPEYAIDGLFSVKSDVFSFGVIILEIISGEKNRGFTRSDHHHTLLGHAWMLFKEGVALEVANHQIRNSKYASEMVRLIHIGLLCVQQHPKDRPNMSQVSVMLNSDSALPEPKEPGFYARRNFPQESEASNAQSSTNYDSITCLSGR